MHTDRMGGIVNIIISDACSYIPKQRHSLRLQSQSSSILILNIGTYADIADTLTIVYYNNDSWAKATFYFRIFHSATDL